MKVFNASGKKSQEQYGNRIKFRDPNNRKFAWDNEGLKETIGLVKYYPRVNPHPSILAEIPGVELVRECEGTFEAVKPAPTQLLSDRASAARQNINLGKTDRVPLTKITGVDGGTDGNNDNEMEGVGLPKVSHEDKVEDENENPDDDAEDPIKNPH